VQWLSAHRLRQPPVVRAPRSQIALCPSRDCGLTRCRAHWADRKQPAECGVDTVSAAVGTTFTLQLAVYDSAGANATARRTITVVSPCPELSDDGSVVDPDATFYCPDTAADGSETGTYVCSAISCDDRRRLASMTGAANSSQVALPRLVLLPFANAANLSLVRTAAVACRSRVSLLSDRVIV
jgi:hypothetical protein